MNTHDPLTHMAATKTDGCPRCTHHNNQPIAGTVEANRGSVVCDYRCAACGHRWATAWGAWFATNSLAA